MKGGKGWNMILAADLKGGIGLRNDLPWKIPQDLKHFQKLTRGSAERESVVVMGRNTWQSIPEKFRPLKVKVHSHGNIRDILSCIMTSVAFYEHQLT